MKNCIVIPTYNEFESVIDLVRELSTQLEPLNNAIIIADDSQIELRTRLTRELEMITVGKIPIHFTYAKEKGGRGAAVQRGFSLALSIYPRCDSFLECDADGSHRAIDIKKVLEVQSEFDVIIGSRYLPESKIINWPIPRRIFSWSLNKAIPRIFGLEICDITNGLRRYTRAAASVIAETKSEVPGFLFLTEEILILRELQINNILEISTIFVNRVKGESTVTFSDIRKSIMSLIKLVRIYK